MHDDEFEWDDAKARSNYAKHNITFEMARDGFNDVFAVSESDLSSSATEDRFRLIAMAEARMLTISFCYRGSRIRIISARRATQHEKRRYYQANTGNAHH